MTLLPTHLAAILDVFQGVVMGLFILSGFVLTVVVLLQEGKGGGIAGAFGGAGAEAFGVKAGTVNRFTAYVGTAFLALALIHAGLTSRINQRTNLEQSSRLRPEDYMTSPSGTGDQPGGTPPAEGTPPGTPPSGGTAPGTPPATPPAAPPGPGTPPEPAPGPAPAPEQPREPAPVPPAMGG